MGLPYLRRWIWRNPTWMTSMINCANDGFDADMFDLDTERQDRRNEAIQAAKDAHDDEPAHDPRQRPPATAENTNEDDPRRER